MASSINRSRMRGLTVISVIIGLPVVLWLGGAGLTFMFSSLSAFVMAFGKAAALCAVAAYCLQPVLSMRYPVIMNLFGGLDVVFLLHKKLGRVVFYFIVAHPVFLFLGGLLQGKTLMDVWNWNSFLIITGVAAFIIFCAVLAVTLYSHIAHRRWIGYHRVFGWLLPVILLHALLAQSQVVENKALMIYFGVLAFCGFAAFLFRSVLSAAFVNTYHYEVVDVITLSPTVTELVLKPIALPMSYTAGQFAYLELFSDAVDDEPHPFSFTTAPNGPYIRFAIKALGDYSSNIQSVLPGDRARLEGPYGNFSFRSTKNHDQVWIAGGVGITPFLSMARSLTPDSKHSIKLFYAAEELEDAVFLRELLEIRKTIPKVLDVVVVNRKTSGFVSLDMIRKEVNDLPAYDYFICGPPVMANILKTSLQEVRVDPEKIHIEEFSML